MTDPIQNSLSILGKNYEIMCKIGEGQSSSVYKIFNNQYQRHFAAKVVPIHEGQEKSVADKVNNEINILNSINHPNIIRIYDFFREDSSFFIIFEDCSGGRLETLISISRFISQPQLQFYSLKILQAIDCIHSNNFAHCEINPSNILIDGHDQPKLIHFRNAVTPKNKHVYSVPNSDLHFLAPEALLPESYDAEKADIWSLGVTFYYMATGKFPWSATTPAEMLQQMRFTPLSFPDNIPEDFQISIKKMLEIRPNQRSTTKELLQDSFFIAALKVKLAHSTSSTSKRLSCVSGQTCKSMLQPKSLQSDTNRLRKRYSMVPKANQSFF